jgi:thymidylate kinase
MTDIVTQLETESGRWPVLRLLVGADIRWALLRPPRDRDDDLDLLVAQEDLDHLVDVLGRHGFVEEPSHGRGSHRFFVGYDGRRFTKIDVVTTLDFGPLHAWQSATADACLSASETNDSTVCLSPGDELWITLLHLLADDGANPAETHRLARLSKLAAAAGGTDQSQGWERALAAILPSTVTGEQLFQALLNGDQAELSGLMAAARPLVRRRCLHEGRAQRGAGWLVRTAWLRVTEPARQWRGRRGLLVAVLGPDGAGKSTLLDLAGRTWPWPHQQVYFGLWPDVRNATSFSAITWPLRRPFRAMFRYGVGLLASVRGRLVLFDRYTYDAAAPPTGRFQTLKRMYFAVLLHCAPAPDLVVLLDAPGELLYARKGEMDPATLDAYRAAVFGHVLRRQGRAGRPRVVTVDATQEPSRVSADVTAAIWDMAAHRLMRKGKWGPR